LGHSLGGIVIKKVRTASSYNIENLLTSKQALLIAQSRPKQWGEILTSVVHLCFFGTPHQGTNSTWLNLGSALTKSKAGSVLEELKLWSPSLIETNQLWVEIADGFTITSFYEMNPYMGILVSRQSRLQATWVITKTTGRARRVRSTEQEQRNCGSHGQRPHHHLQIQQCSRFDVFEGLRTLACLAAIGTVSQGEDQAQRVQRLLESVPALPTAE
jgi:hypothetical protein